MAISAGVVAMLIGGDLAGNPKYPIAVAMVAALLVCTVAGMWNGMLVSRIGMQPIIATLILFVAGRGIAMVMTNAMVIWLYVKPFALLGQGYLLGLPFSIYIVAFLLLVTSWSPGGPRWACSSRPWASTRRRPASPASTPRTSSSGATPSAGSAPGCPGWSSAPRS